MSYLLLLRSHWKLLGLGALCLLLAVQTVRLGHRSNQLEREKIANNELRAELKSISDKKNEQRETTKGNVEKAEKGNREAEERAREIEQAPTPENCETPPEVLRADL